MTVNIDQADALIKEYAGIIKTLQEDNRRLQTLVNDLELALNAHNNKEYDC
jgi:hypothetical protein